MRMPPGWDGLTTILKLWDVDPALQVVICTAYSDRSWAEVQAALPVRSRWLVLKKPFDKVELLQIAHVLVDKWNLEREQELVR
jgi:DNA-binding NtrC family response regulator